MFISKVFNKNTYEDVTHLNYFSVTTDGNYNLSKSDDCPSGTYQIFYHEGWIGETEQEVISRC